MRKLSIRGVARCCVLPLLFLFVTTAACAQDEYRLNIDEFIEIKADDFDSNTTVGVPTGFVQGGERAATINVNYTGFTGPAQTAFQYAVDIWASLLNSPVVIDVDANFTALAPGVLGSAGPTTIHRNFAGAPLANTWYPQALANSLAGSDQSGANSDISCSFSSTFTWYYGLDANPPAGTYDFVSVVLHELGHGLGFLGSASVSGGVGTYGNSGDPYIWDVFVQNGGGASILSFTSGTTALASELQGNNLFWNGASGAAANGSNPPLYAPASWQQGSSYSHLNEASYPAGNPHSLMTPQIGSAEAIHSPGDVALGLFEDMGWSLDNGCTVEGCTDPTACNYDPTADCDNGTCIAGNWYIPNDIDATNLPMVYVCVGDTPPVDYIFADQACAQSTVDLDPFCVNTDWDFICQDVYNDCLYNAGCTNGQWYLPNNVGDGPIVFACSAPADYFLANQTCAQQVVNDDPYCVNTSWDSICSSAYNCCLGINGCSDFSACNYDPTLCPDNSLCVYPGCTDATACNFDPAAGCDDGSCLLPQYYIPVDFSTSTNEPMVLVCAGNEPANYVLADQVCAQARVDFDPFCINTDWDGFCADSYNCCTGAVPGCFDSFACNFDPNACPDPSLCTYSGCTDPVACNFNPTAGCDDGSCILPQYYIPVDFSTSTNEPMVLVCAGNEPANYVLADQVCAQAQVDFDPFCINTDWDGTCVNVYNCCAGAAPGCTFENACNFDPNACFDFTLCTFPGCTNPIACNYDPSSGCDNGSCILPGCQDVAACNYDATAGCDDGSCVYGPSNDICANAQVLNVNETVSTDNTASCQNGPNPFCGGGTQIQDVWFSYTSIGGGEITFFTEIGSIGDTRAAVYDGCGGTLIDCNDDFFSLASRLDFPSVAGTTYYFQAGGFIDFVGTFDVTVYECGVGCTDPIACNFDPTATISSGICEYPGCTYPGACNYDANVACDDGSCTFEGCTDPSADNYDVNAGCDDGSCYFLGCTYVDAENYSAAATLDDGTCTFILGGNCPADLNMDGQVNAGDLLDFLGAFGTTCP